MSQLDVRLGLHYLWSQHFIWQLTVKVEKMEPTLGEIKND